MKIISDATGVYFDYKIINVFLINLNQNLLFIKRNDSNVWRENKPNWFGESPKDLHRRKLLSWLDVLTFNLVYVQMPSGFCYIFSFILNSLFEIFTAHKHTKRTNVYSRDYNQAMIFFLKYKWTAWQRVMSLKGKVCILNNVNVQRGMQIFFILIYINTLWG